MNRLVLLVTLALATPALADERAPLAPSADLFPHITTGFEIMGGNVTSATWRTHAGVSVQRSGGKVRPEIALGGTFGLGSLSVADARALDGTVSVGYLDYGPELQIGLRIGDGGAVDNRVFASAAYLWTNLDSRLMLDAVGGIGGDQGVRFSLGANWADAVGRAAAEGGSKDGDLLLLLVPQQIEVGWIRSAGSDRVGVTLSYGI